MEIKIIEEKKNRIVFEVEGVSYSFYNALKGELHKDSKVKIATFSVKHPLISKPRMIVETDGADPRKALADGANKLKKQILKFSEEFKKEA